MVFAEVLQRCVVGCFSLVWVGCTRRHEEETVAVLFFSRVGGLHSLVGCFASGGCLLEGFVALFGEVCGLVGGVCGLVGGVCGRAALRRKGFKKERLIARRG